MFTGIIETTAKILDHQHTAGLLTLTIERPTDWDIKRGQSISVSGVCLTVEAFDTESFSVKLMQETLNKTSFGTSLPTVVNLERAMLATGRFEGHVVQGHVDITGTVAEIIRTPGSVEIQFQFPPEFDHLIVPKGSIAINGVSLTVVAVTSGTFTVALIPHTLEVTTFCNLKESDIVNLEFDIMGKYILNRSD
jgi:riboflavin synthase